MSQPLDLRTKVVTDGEVPSCSGTSRHQEVPPQEGRRSSGIGLNSSLVEYCSLLREEELRSVGAVVDPQPEGDQGENGAVFEIPVEISVELERLRDERDQLRLDVRATEKAFARETQIGTVLRREVASLSTQLQSSGHYLWMVESSREKEREITVGLQGRLEYLEKTVAFLEKELEQQVNNGNIYKANLKKNWQDMAVQKGHLREAKEIIGAQQQEMEKLQEEKSSYQQKLGQLRDEVLREYEALAALLTTQSSTDTAGDVATGEDLYGGSPGNGDEENDPLHRLASLKQLVRTKVQELVERQKKNLEELKQMQNLAMTLTQYIGLPRITAPPKESGDLTAAPTKEASDDNVAGDSGEKRAKLFRRE